MCGRGQGLYFDPENIKYSVNTNILLPVCISPYNIRPKIQNSRIQRIFDNRNQEALIIFNFMQ